MNWPSRDRWRTLWQSAGAGESAPGWYERLADAYAEPQRHYHNQQHIAECLAEFDQARSWARQPAAVEFALWFHDAVYDPKAGDNEEKSAALARGCLAEGNAARLFTETVVKLVLATKNHPGHSDADTDLIVDVDLSILGRDEKRFVEYETQIRQEYSWVPASIFAPKRIEILERFLARERIFSTNWFRDKYEVQARRNLATSISCLRGTTQ